MTMTALRVDHANSDDLKKFTDERLIANIASLLDRWLSGIVMNACTLVALAENYREAQLRGLDQVKDLPRAVSDKLKRIADGTLAAELVCTFADEEIVIRALWNLPISDQRAYAAGGKEVPVYDPDAKSRERKMKLGHMLPVQIMQAFDSRRGAIRTIQQQKDYFDKHAAKNPESESDPDEILVSIGRGPLKLTETAARIVKRAAKRRHRSLDQTIDDIICEWGGAAHRSR